LEQAETSRRECLVVSRRLADEFPLLNEFQYLCAKDYRDLAAVLNLRHRSQEAYEAGKESESLLEPLCEAEPLTVRYRSALAYLHNQLGTIAAGLGRVEEAVDHFEKARTNQQKLVNQEPKVLAHRQQLAVVLRDHAWFLVFCSESSVVDPRAACDLANESLLNNPKEAAAYTVLAAALCRIGEFEAAVDAGRDALRYRDGGSETVEEDLTRLFLAMALFKSGDIDGAREEYQRAKQVLMGKETIDDCRRNLVNELEELLKANP
jgi:tetratricopeptide (TPR) repeat protein